MNEKIGKIIFKKNLNDKILIFILEEGSNNIYEFIEDEVENNFQKENMPFYELEKLIVKFKIDDKGKISSVFALEFQKILCDECFYGQAWYGTSKKCSCGMDTYKEFKQCEICAIKNKQCAQCEKKI